MNSNFSRCSGFIEENKCTEEWYLKVDIVPILFVWGLFLLIIIVLVISYLCLCCLNRERFENKDGNEEDCSSVCHACGRCCKCKAKKDNSNSHLQLANYGATQVTPLQKSSDAIDKIVKFLIIPVLKFGNSLVKLLFGGKLGLVREVPRAATFDRFGREQIYINEHSVEDRTHFLHFMLVMKVLVFLAFCLATGMDIFFVDSDLSCDASRDCYIFNDNYTQLPITNCSEYIDSRHETTVCYAIVLDFSGAASTMGGLLSATIIETAIIAYLSIFLYTKCCCGCCGTACKRIVWIVLQYLCAATILCVFIGLYWRFVDTNNASHLRRTGDWISFLGHPCSVAFSVLIPWHYVVDQDQCKLCNCLTVDTRSIIIELPEEPYTSNKSLYDDVNVDHEIPE